jgi:hypothetical protein
MSDCCASSRSKSNTSKVHRCPVNGKEYKEVSVATILHHITAPWSWGSKDQAYYFCDDPGCDVVYFRRDNTVIEKSKLRTHVGIKEMSPDSLVCYCFGISASEAAHNPEVRSFVQQKTKEHVCACEARNPSGRCCLKDFPKP